MLAIRFDPTYNCLIEDIDWGRPFNTRLDVFDALMANRLQHGLLWYATLYCDEF